MVSDPGATPGAGSTNIKSTKDYIIIHCTCINKQTKGTHEFDTNKAMPVAKNDASREHEAAESGYSFQ